MVHDVEWSGTLFYKVEGSLDDGTFKATCIDIFVMDIGTGGSTMFKDNEDIIAYRVDHRETLLQAGVYEGLIHSHNNMNAFFSGVDDGTLISEGSDLNHFLSLVVCNAGQYVARVTRKLKTTIKAEAHVTYTKTVSYKTYEDELVTVVDGEVSEGTKEATGEQTIIEYFDLNIQKASTEEPFKEVDERLREIKRGKSRPVNYQYQGGTSLYNQYGQPYYTSPTSRTEQPEPKDPRQLSMFGQEEDEEKAWRNVPQVPVNPPVTSGGVMKALEEEEPTEEDTEFWMVEKVPFHIIKVICTQLLCGSIFASSGTPVNLEEWAKKIDGVYQKRFGSLDEEYNELRIRNWIGILIENIIGYSVDEKFEARIAKKYGLGDDYEFEDTAEAFMHLYACDMITYLRTLHQGKIMEIVIDELEQLMPPDYDITRD